MSFSGFLLKIFAKAEWIFFQPSIKCREVFQDLSRCRDVSQNFPCKVLDFPMFHKKLACILLKNFTAFSTKVTEIFQNYSKSSVLFVSKLLPKQNPKTVGKNKDFHISQFRKNHVSLPMVLWFLVLKTMFQKHLKLGTTVL